VSQKKQKISKSPLRVQPSRKINQASTGKLQMSLKARKLDSLETRRKVTDEAMNKRFSNKDNKLSPQIQSQKTIKKIQKTAADKKMQKAVENELEENKDIIQAPDDSQPKSEQRS
jgi:hypothetical protein